jgi:hypothetical protein
LLLTTIPSGSTRFTVTFLYSFPSTVLKSSASAIDTDSAVKIASAVFQLIMRRIVPFYPPHGNDKMILTEAMTRTTALTIAAIAFVCGAAPAAAAVTA